MCLYVNSMMESLMYFYWTHVTYLLVITIDKCYEHLICGIFGLGSRAIMIFS